MDYNRLGYAHWLERLRISGLMSAIITDWDMRTETSKKAYKYTLFNMKNNFSQQKRVV